MRAIAIGLVLLSHFSTTYATWAGRVPNRIMALGGYVGVELFFVLSGFLIGRILVRLTPDSTSWRGFMVRRWRRTLPLYSITLLLLAWLAPPPDPWRTVPAYALFMQNLAWPLPGQWFGVSWSLAVEEWFYLCFASALVLIARRRGAMVGLAVPLALMLAVPPVLRALDTAFAEPVRHQVVLYLDQIGIGVAAGWLAVARPVLFPRLAWAAPVALALMHAVFWMGTLAPHWTGPSNRALDLDLLGLSIAGLMPSALVWRAAPAWLTVPVRAVSLRAYGLYMLHAPVLDQLGAWRVRFGIPAGVAVAAALVVSGALASASWRWLERPLLARRS